MKHTYFLTILLILPTSINSMKKEKGSHKERQPLLTRAPSLKKDLASEHTKRFFPHQINDRAKKDNQMTLVYLNEQVMHIEHKRLSNPLTTSHSIYKTKRAILSLALSGDGSQLYYVCVSPKTQREYLTAHSLISPTSQPHLIGYAPKDSPTIISQSIVAPSWSGKKICLALNVSDLNQEPKCSLSTIPATTTKWLTLITKYTLEKNFPFIYSFRPHVTWIGDEEMWIIRKDGIFVFDVSNGKKS